MLSALVSLRHDVEVPLQNAADVSERRATRGTLKVVGGNWQKTQDFTTVAFFE